MQRGGSRAAKHALTSLGRRGPSCCTATVGRGGGVYGASTSQRAPGTESITAGSRSPPEAPQGMTSHVGPVHPRQMGAIRAWVRTACGHTAGPAIRPRRPALRTNALSLDATPSSYQGMRAQSIKGSDSNPSSTTVITETYPTNASRGDIASSKQRHTAKICERSSLRTAATRYHCDSPYPTYATTEDQEFVF